MEMHASILQKMKRICQIFPSQESLRQKIVEKPSVWTPKSFIRVHSRHSAGKRIFWSRHRQSFNCFTDRSQHYEDDVAWQITKMTKRPEVQLKLLKFDEFDLMTILSFISAFQMACDTNFIHEGADRWLFHFLIKNPAGAASVPDHTLEAHVGSIRKEISRLTLK